MQFFFLLLFNVFLGAVLYLVISLKLERSATEFRERRLRKEMDEMIKEFNMTAERNISILENRIGMLRKLLEKTGDMRSLDITMAEEESAPRCTEGEKKVVESIGYETQAEPRGNDRAEFGPAYGKNNAGAFIKKSLLLIFNKIIYILQPHEGLPAHQSGPDVGTISNDAQIDSRPAVDRTESAGSLIERDLSGARPGPSARKKPLTEEEIIELAGLADDRYKLVATLFEKGCAIEDISKYAGIPAGEVRLVLNLNFNRGTSNRSN